MTRMKVYKMGLYAIIGVVLTVLLVMNVTRSYQMLDVTLLIGGILLSLWIFGFAIIRFRSEENTRPPGVSNQK